MCFQNTVVDMYKIDLLIQEEGVMSPMQVQILARQIPLDLRLENNPLEFNTLPSRLRAVQSHP